MIQPYILGRGNAGQAMARCLAMLAVQDPELSVAPARWVERGTPLRELPRGERDLVVIANPHGLHARCLREAREAAFPYVVLEKPPCVRPEEIAPLKAVDLPVAVCHGYRQGWGARTLGELVRSGELGEIFSVEGRYWQSSAAEAAGGKPKASWKDDTELNGPHDTLVDLGAHWVDLVHHLLGERALGGRAWLSYANAAAPHRDTHGHLTLELAGNRRAFCSLSKTFHGAGNDLEIHLIGTRKAASWRFADPDRIELGEGGRRAWLPRENRTLGTRQPPFHGAGWLEGYLEILRQACRHLAGLPAEPVPTLREGLATMETLLSLELDCHRPGV